MQKNRIYQLASLMSTPLDYIMFPDPYTLGLFGWMTEFSIIPFNRSIYRSHLIDWARVSHLIVISH